MKVLIALLALSLAPAALADPTGDVWSSKCKGCHGMDGKADTRMGHSHHIPDFTTSDFQKKVTDAQLREAIENGSKKDPKMKAFKGRLTEEEIGNLVRYIRALKPSQP